MITSESEDQAVGQITAETTVPTINPNKNFVAPTPPADANRRLHVAVVLAIKSP